MVQLTADRYDDGPGTHIAWTRDRGDDDTPGCQDGGVAADVMEGG